MSTFRNRDNEKGMALLFALGILSALMVLGVAFVSSSLFYQNIAANRRAKSEAMILARSAANRVAAAVMFYQDQLDNLSESSFSANPTPADYSAVFSVSDPTKNSDSQDQYGEFLRKYGSNDKSLLDVPERLAFSTNDISSSNTRAQWIYVRRPYPNGSDDEDRAGEIIGRFAYQVLPASSQRKMNYFAVLGGGINKSAFHKDKYPGNGSGNDAKYSFSSWEARWGQNIDELNLNTSDYFSGWKSQNDGDLAANYADFYASHNCDDYLLDSSSAEKTAKAKAWFEYWFSEGEEASQIERGPGNRRKFFLGPWDDNTHPWYKRFGSDYTAAGLNDDYDKRNSDDVVKLIASNPEVVTDYEYKKSSDGTDSRYCYIYDVNVSASDRGLPFFRHIAEDKGSFEKIETRRKQIVANFNDYCDKDSIPTSDVPARDWDIDGTHTPKYTGNEETYYINEVALAIQVDCQKDVQGNPFAVYVWPGIIAELIDIYGIDYSVSIPGGGGSSESPTSRTDKYTLDVGFEKFSADVYLTLEMNVNLKLKEGSDPALAPTKTITINPDVSYPNVHTEAPLSFLPIEFTTNTQKDYLVGNTSLDKISRAISAEELKTAVSMNSDITPELDLYEIDTIEIVSFSNFKIDNVKFQLRNLCLKKETSSGVYTGVDFVNVEQVEMEPANAGGVSKLDLDTFSCISYGDQVTRGYAYVGGMEVRDPRQNLNCKYSVTTTKANDWKFDLVLGKDLADTKASIKAGALSSDNDLSKKIEGNLDGKCNSCSNPSSPEDISAIDCDPETVNDPAASGAKKPRISTAVIRNAPMMSPWELGWIHRGAAFQTINLKRAGGWVKDGTKKDISWSLQNSIADNDSWNEEGTEYKDGDGGILDWIKFSHSSRCHGKIDLNLFSSKEMEKAEKLTYGGFTDLDISNQQQDILKALFENIRQEEPREFIEKAKIDGASEPTGTKFEDKSSQLLSKLKTDIGNDFYELRSEVLNLDDGDFWKGINSPNTDAGQEELIGKTINLLDVGGTPGNVFRAVIIAQTITDVGGESTSDNLYSVLSSDDPSKESPSNSDPVKLGKFDMSSANSNPNNNHHYDVITGEAKILVTYERDVDTGKIRIRHIETIE